MRPLDEQLDQLQRLTRTKAPADLLGRIQERLQERPVAVAPAIVWSAAAAFLLVLALNVGLLVRSAEEKTAEPAAFGLDAGEILPQNQLY
jgi:hypothetical protein